MKIQRYNNEKTHSKDIKKSLKDTEKRAMIIIGSSSGAQTVASWPDIKEYLNSKFPEVDISDIRIYRGTPESFKRANWSEVGGLYIPHMMLILIKDKVLGLNQDTEPRSRFYRRMKKYTLRGDVADVVVHELLHAISHKANRTSNRYRHMEEEFVYTNCIDYYKSKGKTEETIVEDIFLPFCLHDVMSSRKEITDILYQVFQSGVPEVEYWNFAEKEKQKFFNENAEILSELVVSQARKKGQYMISCYNQYGRGISLNSSGSNDKSLRFASIGMDCDL